MKTKLITLLYLMALAFGTNLLAIDDDEYNEPKKEEEKAEGEVEEAKASLNLYEGSVDRIFLDTIAKVVGGLLSKAGVPADHASAVGKHVAEKAHEEAKEKAEKAGTVMKVVGGLLSKGGLPKEHADKIAAEAAEEVKKEAGEDAEETIKPAVMPPEKTE